jgi:signal transduction histidine kinase
MASLGQLALTHTDPIEIMTQAISLISQGVSMDYALIAELRAEERVMHLKTAYGWDNDPSPITVQPHSLEYFIFMAQGPVTLEDVPKQEHSVFSDWLSEHQVTGGICVLIPGPEKPYGILGVFSRQKDTFTQEDMFFLQSIANIIALSIRNNHADTEWKMVQDDLKSKLAEIQNLSGHDWGTELDEVRSLMLESRERERLRLAQELHDAPIQDLYGLIYQLDELRDSVKDESGAATLQDFHETINRIINNLRAMCGELRPPSLSPFGLEVAIRDHVEKFREQNPDIQVHMHLMRDQQVLSDSLRLSLFRIYQQAMANVARHANATEVFIRFGWDDESITLEVEDNGIGFELPQQWVELVRQEHFGLMGVAERVESMHGRLEVISAPGDGTVIRARVPCHKNDSQTK